jgi:hypothetical protein
MCTLCIIAERHYIIAGRSFIFMTCCDKKKCPKKGAKKQMLNGGWDFLGFFLYLNVRVRRNEKIHSKIHYNKCFPEN